MNIIIGITGTMGAGKDTIANYLVKKHNFTHHSCSDILRDELKKRGEAESRTRLSDIGNELRSNYGAGVLGERIRKKIITSQESRAVVTALRHPDEIRALGESGDFHLISVDAKVELRFQRLRARNRQGDSATLAEFKQQEAKEMGTEGTGQQIGVCVSQAEYQILNNSTFADLYGEVDRVLSKIGTN
ncbi:dephospho-CoA kinase [Patescibacteria group bacterium]|nr:dephospho-CoA kinase [Patescibacteria group bacterium]